MEAFDASANKRIAHGRVSASWSHEATAPTSEFPDKYRARARRGLFRLVRRFNLTYQLQNCC